MALQLRRTGWSTTVFRITGNEAILEDTEIVGEKLVGLCDSYWGTEMKKEDEIFCTLWILSGILVMGEASAGISFITETRIA